MRLSLTEIEELTPLIYSARCTPGKHKYPVSETPPPSLSTNPSTITWHTTAQGLRWIYANLSFQPLITSAQSSEIEDLTPPCLFSFAKNEINHKKWLRL